MLFQHSDIGAVKYGIGKTVITFLHKLNFCIPLFLCIIYDIIPFLPFKSFVTNRV